MEMPRFYFVQHTNVFLCSDVIHQLRIDRSLPGSTRHDSQYLYLTGNIPLTYSLLQSINYRLASLSLAWNNRCLWIGCILPSNTGLHLRNYGRFDDSAESKPQPDKCPLSKNLLSGDKHTRLVLHSYVWSFNN